MQIQRFTKIKSGQSAKWICFSLAISQHKKTAKMKEIVVDAIGRLLSPGRIYYWLHTYEHECQLQQQPELRQHTKVHFLRHIAQNENFANKNNVDIHSCREYTHKKYSTLAHTPLLRIRYQSLEMKVILSVLWRGREENCTFFQRCASWVPMMGWESVWVCY